MTTIKNIRDAAQILKKDIRHTDTIYSSYLSKDKESEVYLKLENLQLTGAFKVRGALYKMSKLSDSEKAKGVIACSAGNHAQGVAFAAKKYGVKALICLPKGAPISKIEATKSYGADVCLVEGTFDDAYQYSLKLLDEKKYTYIHPFDDEDVIAGQGTVGLEILEDIPDVDAIVVPIGGGGLISGIAIAAKALKPDIKIYGVQSAEAPSMEKALEHHKIESLSTVDTIADGIAVKRPGEKTFAYCRRYVDKILTVTEDEISSAILFLMEKHKLVTEGAGAVSVAAFMFGRIPSHKKIVCLLSGGNIDVTILSKIVTRGLRKSGRTCSFTIELRDVPGELLRVVKIFADAGANIISVHHDRSGSTPHVNSCLLNVTVETKDMEHVEYLTRILKDAGYMLL